MRPPPWWPPPSGPTGWLRWCPAAALRRLAGLALERVLAPTLLIVGGADTNGLALNRRAAARLAAEHRLEVVPGAGHLFEEPGALDAVARLAAAWFAAHLGRRPADTSMG